MNTQEHQVIDDLFDKLQEAERHAGPREPIAEAHIRSRIEAQPGAPYLMAQTIVMQEQALQSAQEQIAQLEDELSRRPSGGGSFLSGLFGGGVREPQPSRSFQREPDNMQGAMPTGAGYGSRFGAPGMPPAQPGRGGGFLAGAAQTAMGVAGGMFLGSMIGNALGGDGEAKAGEAAKPQAEPAAAADDDAGFGGDFDSQDI